MQLLTEELKARLPPLYAQEGEAEPIVHAKFFMPGTRWTWWILEGEPRGDDFLFFGFVQGLENEFGYCCLSEMCIRDRLFGPSPRPPLAEGLAGPTWANSGPTGAILGALRRR